MFPVLSLTAAVSGHPVLEQAPGSVTCYITASIGSVWLLAGLKANSYPNLSCRLVLAWCRYWIAATS